MEKITPEAVAELLATNNAGLAVTIYAPMHRSASPPHMTENQLRFKNLIMKAIEELAEHANSEELSRQLAHHLQRLLDDKAFWENQMQGLFVCARTDFIRMFQLPIDTEEYVAIDDTFHLTPVLGIAQEAPSFYVLALAQHNPRLFEGDMYGLRPSAISLPTSLEDTLRLDEFPKGEQSVAASGSSLNTSAFNGRGGAHDSSDVNVERFLRAIDHTLTTDDTTRKPLILAGIDTETAAFRHISKYPKILEKTISGNYLSQPLEVLFAQAYPIAEAELIAPLRRQAIEAFERLSGSNPARVADAQPTIESAADEGRIDTLLLGMSRTTTDTIRDNKMPVTRITFPQGKLAGAMHKLALQVQNMSGRIVVVDEAQMPNRMPMAAVLRY